MYQSRKDGLCHWHPVLVGTCAKGIQANLVGRLAAYCLLRGKCSFQCGTDLFQIGCALIFNIVEAQMFSESWILEGYVWENIFVIVLVAVAYFTGIGKGNY